MQQKQYKEPLSPLGETTTQLPELDLNKLTEALVAIQVGIQLDTPVPISLLKCFCSHTQIHKAYISGGVQHYRIDNKTCIRLSEFVKAREGMNTAKK